MTKTRQGHNVTTGIVNSLGVAIVTGKYNARNPFPIEAELCKQFGSSRSIVREAVKMLTAKGLISSRPRHGTSILPEAQWNLLDPDVLRWLLERKFSLELLAQFSEVRLAIEPMASRLAAMRATPETVVPIRRAIERMEASTRGEDDSLEADIAFHVAILDATGNRFYRRLEGIVDAALRTSIQMTNRAKGVPQADVDAHRAVFEAIERGNASLAGKRMQELIQEVIDLVAAEKAQRMATTTAKARA